MTLEQLRRELVIQPHHWQAARWLQDHLVIGTDPRMKPQALLSPPAFDLLRRACVSRENLPNDDRVVGTLREGLNVIHRMMLQERLISA